MKLVIENYLSAAREICTIGCDSLSKDEIEAILDATIETQACMGAVEFVRVDENRDVMPLDS